MDPAQETQWISGMLIRQHFELFRPDSKVTLDLQQEGTIVRHEI